MCIRWQLHIRMKIRLKKYLNYLEELDELTDEQKRFCQGIGKDFINLLENTNMSKVYKMPVLMAFYNHGKVRMKVSEAELLESWKEFFSTGTNWKDLEKEITYEEYRKISDKNHIQKIMKMPVHFFVKIWGRILCEKGWRVVGVEG